MHARQWYLLKAQNFHCCSWCFEQIFCYREYFLLQVRCMMSASVEIIFYWAWIVISVWENEPKLKKTRVTNHFMLRNHWSIEMSTGEHSESVKKICQNCMGFSYTFSWSYQVWLLAPPFSPNISISPVKRRKLKRKVIFNSCFNLEFFKLFRFWLFLFHDCPLAENTQRLFPIFFCYLIR